MTAHSKANPTGVGPDRPAPPVALLAGGRSSRFGSDKARVDVGGGPLLLRNLEALTHGGSDAFVVGPPRDTYADLGVRSLPDATPGGGPMAGLVTALRYRRDRYGPGPLGLAACDFIFPANRNRPAALARRLEPPVRPGNRHAAVVRHAGRLNPVLAGWHTDALPELEAALRAGNGSLTRWLTSRPPGTFEAVPAEPPPTFNTQDELKAAAAAARADALASSSRPVPRGRVLTDPER